MQVEQEQIALLISKAADDVYVLDKLVDDEDAPDSVYGFHAQQATEKLLKAVLIKSGIKYPFTHRIVELIDLATGSGIDLPPEFEYLRDLTPFAVEFRYDTFFLEDDEPLDKSAVRKAITDANLWVVNFVECKES